MRKAFIRQIKLMLVVLLGYLTHVCIMPYIQLGDVVPSMLLAVVAIVTVGYGKLRALWVGAFYGIVMETLLPTVPMLNLMFYPVSALLCSVFFADKSAARLQYERSAGKAGRNISPLLRTVMCAAVNTVIYEIVNVAYMYLGGAVLTTAQLGKSLLSVLATTLLTAVVMIPVRKLLGFRKPEPENPAALRFGRPLKLEEE
ncbi:MAG: hypothetical protein IJA77_11330 [Clostridia bacterium]|nr:hypothetical protein [Clostridia bacterium]